MTRLQQVPSIDLGVKIKLNIDEVQALDALAKYDIESFLKVFYAEMGTAYLKPHEAGLRSLFEAIRADLPPIIKRFKSARIAFALQDPVIRSRQEHDELIQRVRDAAAKGGA